MMYALSFFLICFLAVDASIFSASEMAVTVSSRVRLHHMHKQVDARAGVVLTLHILGTWGTVYAAALMSAFLTIYIEVMPKVFSHPEPTALALGSGLQILHKVLLPMTSVVDSVARGSLRIFGIKLPASAVITSTVEELRGAIDLHVGEGAIAHERAMLRSILDLTKVEVRKIMVHRNTMLTLDCTQKPSHIMEKILSAPYTRLPLWKDEPENIVGVLHVKDFLRATKNLVEDIDNFNILVALYSPWFIPETTTLFGQLQSFRERREHLAFDLVLCEAPVSDLRTVV